ncbi:unnamed protein product, partial [marine sediment metagenome]
MSYPKKHNACQYLAVTGRFNQSVPLQAPVAKEGPNLPAREPVGAGPQTDSRKLFYMTSTGLPPKQGLYDPAHEHEACGVGFVASIRGESSHEVVSTGIAALVRLEHRGACGCDPETGDGAGVLFQLPDRFLRREAKTLGIALPEAGAYAVGQIFLAFDPTVARRQQAEIERLVAQEGQQVLGWREVPHRAEEIGELARASLPVIRQLFVGRADGLDQDGFERKLYVIRRLAERALLNAEG